jgi:glycosyltransferase involved in cell wall biosynthesis
VGGVCDPSPVIDLARSFPDYGFVTTFLPANYPDGAQPANVQVTGLLEHEAAWRVVRDSAIYLATTKETFGISTLEAMASGAVVVGYKWGATPEIVGDAGLLVEPGNVPALVGAFQEALDRRQELGEAAMARVQELFSWSDVVGRLAAIYNIEAQARAPGPKVTVVIPCYNYAEYVEQAIWAVRCQTFTNWELIIVDDASTDQSVQAIEEAIKEEPKARLIRHSENLGVANARNRGILAGTGEYVLCLDADDAIDPRYLETVVPALDEDRSLGIAYTGLYMMDGRGRLLEASGWPKEYNPKEWPGNNQIPTCCLYRRDLWKRAGGYRPRHCPHGAGQEDADLWLRMLTLGGGARRVTDHPLFLYRVHEAQTTQRHKLYWKKRQYISWHPYIVDGLYPLASQIGVPDHGSWPVRNYDQPVVSVIIPVGPAHRDTLIDAIDSVAAQAERHWELVVVNDSGKPMDLSPWPFIKYVDTGGGRGAGYARNVGTERATAPLITYLDADDVLQPMFLADCLDAYGTHGRWVYTDLYLLHEDGQIETYEVDDWSIPKLWRSGLAAVTCLYEKRMWAAVGGFDEDLAGREDWDFHLRLARAGFCGVHLPIPGFTYRHATGLRRREGQFKEEIRILQERYSQEELAMACKSCGGSRRAQRPRQFAESKEERGDVPLEYIAQTPPRSYRGRTGRIYRVDAKRNKRIMAHPSDVERLLRLRVFRRIDLSVQAGSDEAIEVEAQPKAASVVTMPTPTGQAVEEILAAQETPPITVPKPPPRAIENGAAPDGGNGIPDPGSLTVAAIKALDLDAEQWAALLAQEREGKDRITAVAFMEAKAYGESERANTTHP